VLVLQAEIAALRERLNAEKINNDNLSDSYKTAEMVVDKLRAENAALREENERLKDELSKSATRELALTNKCQSICEDLHARDLEIEINPELQKAYTKNTALQSRLSKLDEGLKKIEDKENVIKSNFEAPQVFTYNQQTAWTNGYTCAAREIAAIAKAAREPLDNCSLCHGARGGVRGNENIVDGVVMCDYCHAEKIQREKARSEK
jgi:uncharacterized small protein (DUF1192 family)